MAIGIFHNRVYITKDCVGIQAVLEIHLRSIANTESIKKIRFYAF